MGKPLQPLSFDSEVFGFPFYRIVDPDHRKLSAALLRVAGHGRFAVDAKVDASDMRRIARLERMGLRRICTQITLVNEGHVSKASDPASKPVLSDSLEVDGETIAAHANGFTFARFSQDPRLPRAGVRLHMARWIANSLGGRFKVASLGRNFCTFRSTSGETTIDLMSCLEQGQGIATCLLQSVLTTAAGTGSGRTLVITEAENVAALRLYLSCGFVPVRSTACLHLVGLPESK